MRRANMSRAETPHLGVRAERKVELAQGDSAPDEIARELHDESVQCLDGPRCDGLCDAFGTRRVQAGVQPDHKWGYPALS
jgi:hypothetical protein